MTQREVGGVAEVAEVAAALYGLPLAEFIGARDARAKQARAEGNKDLAARISALRKPSTAAWLLNHLVRGHQPDRHRLDELLGLGDQLRGAQERQDGDAVRRLDRRRRQLMADLTRRVRELGAERGHRVTDAVAAEVEGSLRAAVVDADAAAALASGMLVVGNLEASGLEPLELSRVVALPVAASDVRSHLRLVPQPTTQPTPKPEAEAEAQAQAERESRRQEAQQRIESAGAALRQAETAAENATTRLRELEQREAELAAQRRELEDRLAAVAAQLETVGTDRRRAERERRAARRDVDRASAALAAAEERRPP